MKQKQKKSFGVYVPVLLILLSLTIMVSSTFAYFTNTLTKGDGNTLAFGKVELSADTAQGISGSVMDAIPGDSLIENPVSFALSSSSKPAYVRAKISYSGDVVLSDYLDALRSATDYGFASTAKYHWTEKSGNYVYLVDSSDNLLRVADTTTYTLVSSFDLPRSVKNLPNNAQYMAEIQFHIVFQALQADNIEDTSLNAIKELFNSQFPESSDEAYVEPVPVAILAGAETNPSYSTNFLGVNGLTRSTIKSITFEGASGSSSSGALVSGAPVSYDIVANVGNGEDLGKIVLYATNDGTGKYDVIIESNDVIKLPADCTKLFGYLTNCTTLSLTNVDTSAITTINNMFFDCKALQLFTIPSSVTSIGNYAFYGCANLNSITIPSSVTSIGYSAFYGCSGLTSITIPSSVTSIGDFAFSECTNLTSVTILSGVTSIGTNAFSECTNLTSIIIPSSVTNISSGAFEGCTSLTSITIPSSVTSIGESAFVACSNLTDVYYTGTAQQWNAITIGSGNTSLTGANIHYNS